MLTPHLRAIIDAETDQLCSVLAGPLTAWRRAIIYASVKRAVLRAISGATATT
jgi:hypothetical protein